MSITGFASAQAAYDAAEPDSTDVCEGCEDNLCDICADDCCGPCTNREYEDPYLDSED